MNSNKGDQEAPDVTELQSSPSGPLRWLLPVMVTLTALAQALGVPFVTEEFGVKYGAPASALVFILLFFSLRITPDDRQMGGQFVYLLSFFIPAVKAYRDAVNEINETYQINTSRYLNMASLLKAYNLQPTTKLVAPNKKLKDKQKIVEIKELADEAAAAICSNAALPCVKETMARLLELLYHDQFILPTSRLWQNLLSDDKNKLAQLLLQADFFAPTIVWKELELKEQCRAVIVVREVLKKQDISDFDLNLTRDVIIRLNGLWKLATEFADDALTNKLPDRRAWKGNVPSLAFVNFVTGSIPPTSNWLHRLEATSLAVNLVQHVTKELFAKLSPPLAGDLEKMAFVSAGLFLRAGNRHPEMHAELARQAHKGDLGVFAARVLLARMWYREKNQVAEDKSVPLKELLDNWEDLLKEAHKEYGDLLTESVLPTIRDQVCHGFWPTEYPQELILNRVSSKIIEAAHFGDQHVEDTIRDVQRYLKKLDHSVKHSFSVPIEELRKKIFEFDPTANGAERKRMMDDLIDASELAQTQPFDELVDAVHSVEEVDHELCDTIDNLTSSFPSGSRRYLLTWKAKSGPVSELIEYLKKGPRKPGQPDVGSYELMRFTPYGRIGWLSLDQDFDTFLAGLTRDLDLVYLEQKKIISADKLSAHPLQDIVITVQQIEAPVKISIPSE